MKVIAEDGGLEHVDRDMHGEDTHPVHQPAAPFLVLREKEAAHAARDAVADDGFRVIKEEFSREGHGDGDDAVVKMPTPEKLCFFLQMNAISWGSAARRGCASAGRVLRPAESSKTSSVTGSVINAAGVRQAARASIE